MSFSNQRNPNFKKIGFLKKELPGKPQRGDINKAWGIAPGKPQRGDINKAWGIAPGKPRSRQAPTGRH
jgi:hypothetical protein